MLSIVIAISYWQTRDLAQGSLPETFFSHNNPTLNWREGLTTEKPLLIYFWASWCPICGLTDDSIEALSKDYAVISVASHSGSSHEVAEFMANGGLSFPVIIDEDGSMAAGWGVPGFPASFIVDEQSKIRFSLMGLTTGLGLRARMWLAE